MLTSTYLAVRTGFAGRARAIEAAIEELVKPASSVPALAADASGDLEGRMSGRPRGSDRQNSQVARGFGARRAGFAASWRGHFKRWPSE